MNGDTESGRKLLKKSLSALPNDVMILSDLAALELQQMNFNLARDYALKALEIDENFPPAQDVFMTINAFSRLRRGTSDKIQS